MKTLPEICEFCRREMQALERVIVLVTQEKKRAARVTFRESVGGVRCLDCAAKDWKRNRGSCGRPVSRGRDGGIVARAKYAAMLSGARSLVGRGVWWGGKS